VDRVRFLVDANMSPLVAELLRDAGHEAMAVRDVGLGDASDDELLDHAAAEDLVVVSHDTDFGTLLAFRRLSRPSFILVRQAVSVDHCRSLPERRSTWSAALSGSLGQWW
jgi:predicted nuclease of predicted toxin-antitoxin system